MQCIGGQRYIAGVVLVCITGLAVWAPEALYASPRPTHGLFKQQLGGTVGNAICYFFSLLRSPPVLYLVGAVLTVLTIMAISRHMALPMYLAVVVVIVGILFAREITAGVSWFFTGEAFKGCQDRKEKPRNAGAHAKQERKQQRNGEER